MKSAGPAGITLPLSRVSFSSAYADKGLGNRTWVFRLPQKCFLCIFLVFMRFLTKYTPKNGKCKIAVESRNAVFPLVTLASCNSLIRVISA